MMPWERGRLTDRVRMTSDPGTNQVASFTQPGPSDSERGSSETDAELMQ